MFDVEFSERTLIRTKLNLPPLPEGLVVRPRLVASLDDGESARVILLAAPAGYGKTTLALQWLAQRTGDTAWVSLSHRESEPERFASYLVTAIRNQRPGALAQAAALLDARTAPPWGYFSEVLLSELAVLEEPLLLALDDYPRDRFPGGPRAGRPDGGGAARNSCASRLSGGSTRHGPSADGAARDG